MSLVSTDAATPQSLFLCNEHLRRIARARVREITTSIAGQVCRGVLQSPPTEVGDGPYPVIVYAYPDHAPSLTDSLSRINSQTAVWFPFQYLLARGFSIFHAPLATKGETREPAEFIPTTILPWLDTLNREPDVLPDQFGFFGHSNAGVVALTLEAHSDRFKAIVAANTFPDLAASAISTTLYEGPLECAAQITQSGRAYYETEHQPYSAGGPFWQRKEWFLRNSPIFNLEHARTPLLLIADEIEGRNKEMEVVFSTLYARGIPVEMALYWGEGHVVASPANLRDVWVRTERFFDRYVRSH
jgi:dipeptidyl aminopeptidase/acylaminoacyl peptidase